MSENWAVEQLKSGLNQGCADDITEVLCNLSDGTCDWEELIPVLEKVAAKDKFYYFDDNGAGGFPHPSGEPSSFRDWARSCIKNIRENQKFGSESPLARDLKSLNTSYIKSTLEKLLNSDCRDQSLIPIIGKIARKDKYTSYSYSGGYSSEPEMLGDLAQQAINQIKKNIDEENVSKDLASVNYPAEYLEDLVKQNFPTHCSFCGGLPDEITVNTGRDHEFPDAFYRLIKVDSSWELRRCPNCGTYFQWVDLSSWTGSGNNDEERLTRLSVRVSRLLDKLLPLDSDTAPEPGDVSQYFEDFPLDLLLKVLSGWVYSSPNLAAPFVPHLMTLLLKTNNTSIGSVLRSYVSSSPERATELLEIFCSAPETGYSPLTETLSKCLKVVAKKFES